MAQSALTVTPENPTPPTNMSFVGATPPLDPAQPAVDDGTAATLTVFAAKTAATNTVGYPGANISYDHEGKGTEVTVTATSPNPSPAGQFVSFSCLGNYTSTPNTSHASTLSGSATPTLSAASGASNVSGSGTTLLTLTGTNFNRGSEVYLNGVRQQTNFVSATSLTVTNAMKKLTAGTLPVYVVSNGQQTAPVNWTLT